MDTQENLQDAEEIEKTYKTSEAKRLKALERYYTKKTEILKMISLKTIMANGRIPSQPQILKHELNWEDIARGLQEYIKDKEADKENHVPVEIQNTQDRIKILQWEHELDFYKKTVNRGSSTIDDFTRMYRRYIETYLCEHCNKHFSKENPRTWNIDETTGFYGLIICGECLPK